MLIPAWASGCENPAMMLTAEGCVSPISKVRHCGAYSAVSNCGLAALELNGIPLEPNVGEVVRGLSGPGIAPTQYHEEGREK
ncbi:MAG: hypothetical protein DMG70_03875 [Acidobacteria bacterium]|nr:MAG: hypothetical protein DMG70_03875 [Acidobacteriota bacterium]PYY05845.1 MAG: hypothetical protein DMG69_25335 [Acidobacteriota bacterium]